MIKSELVSRIAYHYPDLTEKDVKHSIDQILNTMTDALSSGERIEIRGFGSFGVRYLGPRKARNPKTGERLMIGAKYSATFKTSKGLRERVKAGCFARPRSF